MLSLGDLVLVKNIGLSVKHRIADIWEHKSYVVVSQPNRDVPVYDVKDTSTRARKTRLLHRILLLPFMGLPRVEQSEEIENVRLLARYARPPPPGEFGRHTLSSRSITAALNARCLHSVSGGLSV